MPKDKMLRIALIEEVAATEIFQILFQLTFFPFSIVITSLQDGVGKKNSAVFTGATKY